MPILKDCYAGSSGRFSRRSKSKVGAVSLRLEMLQVARLAPKQLGESRELVSSFIRSQRNADGGFKDRSGNSDLYYTVFGLEALRALQLEVSFEPTEKYLRSFGSGESLDFVHLTCLARCWAILTKEGLEPASRRKLLEEIETFRYLDRG